MKFPKTFADYCTPAKVYLGISLVAVIIVIIQNLLNSNDNELCIGVHKCTMSHKVVVLIFKIIYMLFWAWLLNFLCKKGLTKLAWFILVIPFLLIAVLLGGMIIAVNNNNAVDSKHVVHVHHDTVSK